MGSLVDLDPPDRREPRWPFYVGWAVGGIVLGAALLGHLPASIAHPAEPAVTEPPAAVPASLRVPTRFQVAPIPIDASRP